MNRPLRVYVSHLPPITALTYYRVLQPLMILELVGKVQIVMDDMHPNITAEKRARLLDYADVGMSHCIPTVQMFRDYKNLQALPPRYVPYPKAVKYSPLWITDIDDIYDWVSPTNPAFATWGVRDMEGVMIPPGGRVVATLRDGKEEVIFEDGAPLPTEPDAIFSVKANFMRIAKLKTAINESACVTVTTETLKKHILTQDRPKRVEVFPNSMWKKDFLDLKLHKHKGIRVLWQGGGSHYDDWLASREGIMRAAKKWPEITWVIYGQNYTFLFPEELKNIEYHYWVDFPAHRMMLAMLDCDINLALISPNNFSRGKSALKWYEASALSNPMATLATKCAPYQEEIEDGKTGMLFDGPDEFVEKLGALIDNEKLRREIAQNAHEWVWENRDATKWALKLLALLEELREEKIKREGDLRELVGATEDLEIKNAITV